MKDLPDYPSPSGAEIGLMDYGSLLVPALGGPVQRVNRLGNRFRIAVTMPPMTTKTARAWIARLTMAKSEGARMPLPLLDFNAGAPGAPLINGVGQAGSTLNIDGLTPNYVFREGQTFSILTGGKHHLYMVAAETIASTLGVAALPLTTALRRQHLDNDPLHVAKPMIEGFVGGDEFMWSLSVEQLISLQFDISEAQ